MDNAREYIIAVVMLLALIALFFVLPTSKGGPAEDPDDWCTYHHNVC